MKRYEFNLAKRNWYSRRCSQVAWETWVNQGSPEKNWKSVCPLQDSGERQADRQTACPGDMSTEHKTQCVNTQSEKSCTSILTLPSPVPLRTRFVYSAHFVIVARPDDGDVWCCCGSAPSVHCRCFIRSAGVHRGQPAAGIHPGEDPVFLWPPRGWQNQHCPLHRQSLKQRIFPLQCWRDDRCSRNKRTQVSVNWAVSLSSNFYRCSQNRSFTEVGQCAWFSSVFCQLLLLGAGIWEEVQRTAQGGVWNVIGFVSLKCSRSLFLGSAMGRSLKSCEPPKSIGLMPNANGF